MQRLFTQVPEFYRTRSNAFVASWETPGSTSVSKTAAYQIENLLISKGKMTQAEAFEVERKNPGYHVPAWREIYVLFDRNAEVYEILHKELNFLRMQTWILTSERNERTGEPLAVGFRSEDGGSGLGIQYVSSNCRGYVVLIPDADRAPAVQNGEEGAPDKLLRGKYGEFKLEKLIGHVAIKDEV